MLDYMALLKEGREVQRKAHEEGEKKKLGNLRGGSVGILLEDDTLGTCHRVAHLRQIGIQTPSEPETHNMFALGRSNEDIISQELLDAGVKIKRESEIPVTVELDDGTKITGSPDIVIMDDSGSTPICVLELKSASARGSSVGYHYKLKPKNVHLMQLGFYMLGLGVDDGKLHYCSRVKWNIPKKMPSSVQEVMRKGWDAVEQYGGCQIQPFDRVYDVWFDDDGLLNWSTPDKGGKLKSKTTVISADTIMDYYEYVNSIKETKELGNRPLKDGYSACDYCKLNVQCDRYEEEHNSYDVWLDEVKLEIEELNKEYGYK